MERLIVVSFFFLLQAVLMDTAVSTRTSVPSRVSPANHSQPCSFQIRNISIKKNSLTMPRLAFIGTPPKKPASKTKGKKSLQTTLQSAFHLAAMSVEAVVSPRKPQRQGKKGKSLGNNLLLGEQSSITSFFGGKENLPQPSLQDHGAASTKTRNNESSKAGFFQSSEAAGIIQPAELGKRKHDPIAAEVTYSSKRKVVADVPVVKGLVLAEPATGASCHYFPFLVIWNLLPFPFFSQILSKILPFLTIR